MTLQPPLPPTSPSSTFASTSSVPTTSSSTATQRTPPPLTLVKLKALKNRAIGNARAKAEMGRDAELVGSLNPYYTGEQVTDGDEREVATEAAHVIASIAYGASAPRSPADPDTHLRTGPDSVLETLLRANAPHALVCAIASAAAPPASSSSSSSSAAQPKIRSLSSDEPRAAATRALRTLAVRLADCVGPAAWGLREDPDSDVVLEADETDSQHGQQPGSEIGSGGVPEGGTRIRVRDLAGVALDWLFEPESLDVLLPLLTPAQSSKPTATSVAQMLGFALRRAEHRAAVVAWVPSGGTSVTAATPTTPTATRNRGWEKPAPDGDGEAGGWVCRTLLGLVGQCANTNARDRKLVEAALWALGAVAKDEPSVAGAVGEASLACVLMLAKTVEAVDVQVAACLCATHILRALPGAAPDGAVLSVLSVLNHLIAEPGMETRTKACFVLYHLVADHPALALTAYERGSVGLLAAVLRDIAEPEDGDDEAESVSALREAALTCLAALALFENNIRLALTSSSPSLLPTVLAALTHPRVGVRYAGCQCVRALSRGLAVLRTNIVDSGLGMGVFAVLMRQEDKRVIGAALAAVCNIVNGFSPLRPIYLDQGLMPRLVKHIAGSEATLRLSALWAVKNLLSKSSGETKRDVMAQLGWPRLALLLGDPDVGIQEQAWHILRNLAENEAGVEMAFRELGPAPIVAHLVRVLSLSSATTTPVAPAPANPPPNPNPTTATHNQDSLLPATCVVANIANTGTPYHAHLLSSPALLRALRSVLADAGIAVRRPAVHAILELARGSAAARRALAEAGVRGTLAVLVRGGSTGAEERDVVEQAKMALDWLEHGELDR
ncbi:unnamed protein product [Mycena citricolor]|uniref:Armadillo repeat-containing protein 8 n=1 Tax=Mycena citricolor TaxID=2018698 RepID=A0AAD2HZP5_9AGAR|nr:unnamed protein product [Mycena citricolor]